VKDSSEVMVELAGRGEIELGDIERIGEWVPETDLSS
jgi:hypothetical protein